MARNERIRAARIRLDMTQEEFAEAVGVDSRTVRAWEAGKVAYPHDSQLARLRELTGLSPEDLGFRRPSDRRGPRGRTGHGRGGDVLQRRELMTLVASAMVGAMATPVAHVFPRPASAGRVSQDDVLAVRKLLSVTGDTQRTMGGGVLRPEALLLQFSRAVENLHGRFRSEVVRQELHSAIAHYGNNVGWALIDGGRQGAAQRVFGVSIAAAEGAGDEKNVLRALAITSLARQEIYLGDPRSALDAMAHLEPIEPSLPSDVRAIVRALRARALGGLGDSQGVERTVNDAEDEFFTSTEGSAIRYETPGFGVDQMYSDIGHAFSALVLQHGQPAWVAAERLQLCIESPSGEARTQAIARINLLNVRLAQGDGEEALKVANQYVSQHKVVQSAQIADVVEVGLRMVEQRRGIPGAVEVSEILHGLRRPA